MSRRDRQLRVSSLARVEGEGALRIVVDDGQVTHAELQIYEPPRFFEAFLRGRQHTEVADITSRICGICPVAYQTSAWQAIEDVCGVVVAEPIAALRRLLYCGEWISSHALHIYLLHAPDFLGYADAIELAGDHRAFVERGLALKKAGNAVLERIGGRAIHPVNTRVGGFYSAPMASDLAPLRDQLRRALDDALATVAWVATFDFPDLELDHELLTLHDPSGYAIESGQLATSSGTTFPPSEFSEHVVEHQVPYSTALHARLDGRPYLTGPLARYSLNSAQLSPLARQSAAEAGLGPTCRNPFRSIVVRAVEVVYAIDEALRIIDGYERPEVAAADVPPRAGIGHGVSEAPRGVLYHRYELDALRVSTGNPANSWTRGQGFAWQSSWTPCCASRAHRDGSTAPDVDFRSRPPGRRALTVWAYRRRFGSPTHSTAHHRDLSSSQSKPPTWASGWGCPTPSPARCRGSRELFSPS